MSEHEAARDLLNMQLSLLGDERGTRRNLIPQELGNHLAQGRHALAIACQTEALEIAERLQVPMLAMARLYAAKHGGRNRVVGSGHAQGVSVGASPVDRPND